MTSQGSIGSVGGSSGGATNYLNMVTTPTVVASGTGYAQPTGQTQPFVVVSAETMAAAGIPTGATLALLEITVNSQNGPLEVRGRVSSLTPNLTLAKSGLPGFNSTTTRNVTQALMPLASNRSFEYSIVPDGAVSSGASTWSITVIGFYSPGIASAGTQTTVFFENETTLANPLATGVTTFNVGPPALGGLGLVPESATAIVLQILTQNGPNGGSIILKGRGESTHGWKTLISGSGGGANTHDTDALQVVIPLSAAKTFQLDKDSTFFAIQVYAHGYLLPGTTAATIQTGTAALPTGAGFAGGAVITHGLGFTPPHVRVVLRCKDGSNTQGYAAGIELDVNSGAVVSEGGNPSTETCHVSINETTIVVFTNGTANLAVINPAGSGFSNITGGDIAKWELKAYWARVDGVIPSAMATIQTGTAALPSNDGFSNGSVITHGLGFTPPHVRVVLRCLDATNAQNYAAGVELDIADATFNVVAAHPAYHVSIDETGIRVFRATTGAAPAIPSANGVGLTSIDITKWQIKAYWTRVSAAIPEGGATKAWVNFDGTRDASGATSTSSTNRFIRASANVASVFRHSATDFTISFITPMVDANYAVATIHNDDQNGATGTFGIYLAANGGTDPTSGAFRIVGNVSYPASVICATVFR